MKMLKCYVLLLVVVIGVSTAENCTNSTSAECCVCPEEECDSCPPGFYRLDTVYLPDTECSSASTTYSLLNSTTPSEENPTLSPINDITSTSVGENSTNPNNTLCVQNCPDGFYGNNGTCIECKADFENVSGRCSPITTRPSTTTPASTKNNDLGVIIGGACGGAVVLLIIIIVAVVIVCRKRRKQPTSGITFTERLQVIQSGGPKSTKSSDEDEEVGKADPHIYENTAQFSPDFSNMLQQGHERVTRYTPDPTARGNLQIVTDNEESTLDQLPPAPPPPKPSTRKTKTKKSKLKPKPKPTTEEVYKPVGPENDTETDANAQGAKAEVSDDELNYENENEVREMKSKMSKTMSPKDHEEDDYENDEMVNNLRVDINPRRQELDVEQNLEPEHELEDYENEAMLERLRQPTRDPLSDEAIYQNI